jgi:hypothetical protein
MEFTELEVGKRNMISSNMQIHKLGSWWESDREQFTSHRFTLRVKNASDHIYELEAALVFPKRSKECSMYEQRLSDGRVLVERKRLDFLYPDGWVDADFRFNDQPPGRCELWLIERAGKITYPLDVI